MGKILLLDCDGTIREPISNNKFIQHPNDQKVIRGAAEAIESYALDDWVIIGITNQGGIEAGHKSLQDAILEQRRTLELLPEMQAIYLCPNFKGETCWRVGRGEIKQYFQGSCNQLEGDRPDLMNFRKPGAGMLFQAIHDCIGYVPAERSDFLYVGDRSEDREAAGIAWIDFMWASDWWKKPES